MYEPLDTQNPEIELDLTFLRSRLGYEEKQVRIQTQSGDLILFKGIMFDGKLKGIVDKKLSNHPAWRSRLFITFGEYKPWKFKNESESNIDVSLHSKPNVKVLHPYKQYVRGSFRQSH